jgi:hypothetical protein
VARRPADHRGAAQQRPQPGHLGDAGDGRGPKFTESQRLPDVSYEGFARSLGLGGIAADKPEQVAPAWEQALAADRPVVLDFRTDPDVPPIPPHATFEQAKDLAKALLHGGPNSLGTHELGRHPADAELAVRLGVTEEDLRDTQPATLYSTAPQSRISQPPRLYQVDRGRAASENRLSSSRCPLARTQPEAGDGSV